MSKVTNLDVWSPPVRCYGGSKGGEVQMSGEYLLHVCVERDSIRRRMVVNVVHQLPSSSSSIPAYRR